MDCINPLVTWNRFWITKRRTIEQKDYVASFQHLEKAQALCDNKIETLSQMCEERKSAIKDLIKDKKYQRAKNEFLKVKRAEKSIKGLETYRTKLEVQAETIDMGRLHMNIMAELKEFAVWTDPDKVSNFDKSIEDIENMNKSANDIAINMGLMNDRLGANDVIDETTLLDEFMKTYMPEAADSNNTATKIEKEEEPLVIPSVPLLPEPKLPIEDATELIPA